MIFVGVLALAVAAGCIYAVSKLPSSNCNQDCNQGRRCDCGSKSK